MCYCRWGTCGMWNAGNNYPVQLQPVSRLQTEVFLVAFASLPVSKLQQGLVIFIAISRRILTIINNSFQLCWISWLKAVFWLSSCLKSKWIESIIRLNLGQGGYIVSVVVCPTCTPLFRPSCILVCISVAHSKQII